MDSYEIELEPDEPDRVAAVVPALPGLLLLGRDVDEVRERARARSPTTLAATRYPCV